MVADFAWNDIDLVIGDAMIREGAFKHLKPSHLANLENLMYLLQVAETAQLLKIENISWITQMDTKYIMQAAWSFLG